MRSRFHIITAIIVLTFGCEGSLSTEARAGSQRSNFQNNTPNNGGPNNVANISSGKALYDTYCLSCHGEDAIGTPIWEGSIQGFEPIDSIVLNGRGTMAAIAMEQSEVDLVQTYLISLGFVDWSGLSGEEVFQAGCATCHGQNAEGNERGFQLRFRDPEFFDYITRKGRNSSLFETDMAGYDSSRVSDQQMAEMITWIDAIPNETTGEGLYIQFCSNCHGLDGRSGSAGNNVNEGSITGVTRNGKEDSVTNGNYMPGWSSALITDAELSLMQAYVNSL